MGRPTVALLGQIAAAVVGGLVLFHLTQQGTAQRADFFGAIDANVSEHGGAAVFDAAHTGGHPVGRIRISHQPHFIGYCIGEPVRSVSTQVEDERWFILPSHNVVSAAMVDGGPPSDSQPTHCPGELLGPRSLALSFSVRAGRLILSASAPGATMVGFALRRSEASGWQGLALTGATGGEFSEQAGPPGPYVAIAAACWARGAPAHPTGAREYVEEVLPLGGAPSSLRTAASTTVSEAVHAACSPGTSPGGSSSKPRIQASAQPPAHHVARTPVPTMVQTVIVQAPSPAPSSPAQPSASTTEPRAGGASTQNLFAESGPPPTGTDAHGFNVGSGCSDDPASPRPGCNDSPSAPIGDPLGPCANGITIDRQTTSCGLAENVYSNYTEDGSVTARSPKRSRDYTFTCKTAGRGTTGYTICLGRAGSSTLYLRWRR
jgi:hypothetical protein